MFNTTVVLSENQKSKCQFLQIDRILHAQVERWSLHSCNRSQAGSEFYAQMSIIRTMLISVLMGAKMQRLELVRRHPEFLSYFSIPQANPTQPVGGRCHSCNRESRLAVICMGDWQWFVWEAGSDLYGGLAVIFTAGW